MSSPPSKSDASTTSTSATVVSSPHRRQGLNHWVTRYLSNLRYLRATLLVYLLCNLGTYVWLGVQFGTFRGKAITIAYDVATGASPVAYMADVKPLFPVLWLWLAVLHVFSWLIVPIVIATAIDVMYRVYEQGRLRAGQRLRRRIRRLGSKRGYTGMQLEDFTERTLEDIEDLRAV